MRELILCAGLFASARCALAQAPGRFPPDSLVNTTVIPRDTPVQTVIGRMRNFSADLGVRCTHCHLGEEGKPLSTFDFASDEKRTKIVARDMISLSVSLAGCRSRRYGITFAAPDFGPTQRAVN